MCVPVNMGMDMPVRVVSLHRKRSLAGVGLTIES